MLKTLETLIFLVYEKRFTVSQFIAPIILTAISSSTFYLYQKCTKIEQSTQQMNDRLNSLQRQIAEKDLLIQRLSTKIVQLQVELGKAQNFSTSHINTNLTSADLVAAQNEMTQFWVNTGIKIVVVFSVVAGVYILVKGISLISIIKAPFTFAASATNYISQQFGWQRGVHKFYFDEATRSQWLVKIRNEDIYEISVRLFDTQNYLSPLEFLTPQAINVLANHPAALVIANQAVPVRALGSISDVLMNGLHNIA